MYEPIITLIKLYNVNLRSNELSPYNLPLKIETDGKIEEVDPGRFLQQRLCEACGLGQQEQMLL